MLSFHRWIRNNFHKLSCQVLPDIAAPPPKKRNILTTLFRYRPIWVFPHLRHFRRVLKSKKKMLWISSVVSVWNMYVIIDVCNMCLLGLTFFPAPADYVSLKTVLANHPKKTVSLLLKIATKTAEALSEIHAEGFSSGKLDINSIMVRQEFVSRIVSQSPIKTFFTFLIKLNLY